MWTNDSSDPVGTVLVDSELKKLSLTSRVEDVQPCSIDLRVGKKMWQISAIPSVAHGFDLEIFLKNHEAYNQFDISEKGMTLTPGSVYLVELDINTANIPEDIFAVANPKSSAGRIDLHCILIAEGASEFNSIPRGSRGGVFLIVIPQSFPVEMVEGVALVQIRLIRGARAFLTRRELLTLHHSYGIVKSPETEPVFTDAGLMLHLDLSGVPSNLVSLGTGEPIALRVDRSKLSDPAKYFREKKLYNGGLHLEPGEFLLARTIEKVAIPPLTCAEMLAYNEAQGEIRSHYAGFIDRGFGYGRNGEVGGADVVYEIRNISSVPVLLSHGQPIATLRYEYLEKEPDLMYGQEVGSNYQGQTGIRLAKYFKSWGDTVSETVVVSYPLARD